VSNRALAVLVAGPAVLCALLGLTHPVHLTAATAEYWRNLHIVLIPVFPLIGAAPWLIARRGGTWFGRIAAIFGYLFATFYTALDILAGVAGGALVEAGDATAPVFAIARVVGAVGVAALVIACATAGISAYRVGGVATLPGALLACIGAALVQPGHIYAGLGTLAMLLLAGGLVVLVFTASRSAKPALVQLP